jgi:hypothetical protein
VDVNDDAFWLGDVLGFDLDPMFPGVDYIARTERYHSPAAVGVAAAREQQERAGHQEPAEEPTGAHRRPPRKLTTACRASAEPPLGLVALHHLLGLSFLLIILSNHGTPLSHQSR